ncbi:hypothetical protein ACLOJK_039170 [Asimina triloba]
MPARCATKIFLGCERDLLRWTRSTAEDGDVCGVCLLEACWGLDRADGVLTDACHVMVLWSPCCEQCRLVAGCGWTDLLVVGRTPALGRTLAASCGCCGALQMGGMEHGCRPDGGSWADLLQKGCAAANWCSQFGVGALDVAAMMLMEPDVMGSVLLVGDRICSVWPARSGQNAM